METHDLSWAAFRGGWHHAPPHQRFIQRFDGFQPVRLGDSALLPKVPKYSEVQAKGVFVHGLACLAVASWCQLTAQESRLPLHSVIAQRLFLIWDTHSSRKQAITSRSGRDMQHPSASTNRYPRETSSRRRRPTCKQPPTWNCRPRPHHGTWTRLGLVGGSAGEPAHARPLSASHRGPGHFSHRHFVGSLPRGPSSLPFIVDYSTWLEMEKDESPLGLTDGRSRMGLGAPLASGRINT